MNSIIHRPKLTFSSICPSRAVCWWKAGVPTSGRRSCVMQFRSTAPPMRRGVAWARPCSLWAPARPPTASWRLWSSRPPAPSGPSPSSPGSSDHSWTGGEVWFKAEELSFDWMQIQWKTVHSDWWCSQSKMEMWLSLSPSDFSKSTISVHS